jgi:peptidoglycan/xylan/chitin deacetylase (PgdA/CDA1 family)
LIFAKKLIGLFGGIVPLNILFRYHWSDCLVLTYHSLSGYDVEPEINKNPYRTPSQFSEDIRFIREHFHVVGLKEFLEIHERDGKFPEKSLLITFDDGLSIQYDHMYPVLRSYGIPATFFINNAFLDNRDLHYERKKYILLRRLDELGDISLEERILDNIPRENGHESDLKNQIHRLPYKSKETLDSIAGELGISFRDYLSENKIYLTSEQVETMLRNDMTIGGHSIDHPDFTELSMADQVHQILYSVNDLAERFRLDYKTFAFPYNDVSLDTALFENISDDIDVSFGSSGPARDEFRMHFQRGSIDNSNQRFRQALAVLFGKYYGRMVTGNHFIKRY